MLVMSLLWLLGGAMLGALTFAAALLPPSWRGHGWRILATLVGIGALAGLAGGWAGTVVFGRIYGSATAAWVAILAAALSPWLSARIRLLVRPRTSPDRAQRD